jgi:hypothetical protein
MANHEKIEEIEEVGDLQTLEEIKLFFDMAIELENNKFNLYPKKADEMQLKCIELVMQRLEFFEFE